MARISTRRGPDRGRAYVAALAPEARKQELSRLHSLFKYARPVFQSLSPREKATRMVPMRRLVGLSRGSGVDQPTARACLKLLGVSIDNKRPAVSMWPHSTRVIKAKELRVGEAQRIDDVFLEHLANIVGHNRAGELITRAMEEADAIPERLVRTAKSEEEVWDRFTAFYERLSRLMEQEGLVETRRMRRQKRGSII